MEQNAEMHTEETQAEPEVIVEMPVAEVKPAPQAPKEFDWDSIGKKHEIYSPDERKRLEDEYDQNPECHHRT